MKINIQVGKIDVSQLVGMHAGYLHCCMLPRAVAPAHHLPLLHEAGLV